MVTKLIARGIRAALDEMGYVLWKKDFLQYGISVYDDIARLNRAWDRSVNTFFDVGANVGQTTRQVLRRFPSARVKGAVRKLSSGRVGYVYAEFNDLQPRQGVSGGALTPIAELLAPFGFRYVATYTDFVLPEGEMYVCANALFALPPH